MSPKPDEYQVEGYGVVTEGYDAPYHPAKDFDPNVDFEHAGAPKEAAKAQEKRKGKKRPSEFDSPRKRNLDEIRLTAAVPPTVTSEEKTEASKSKPEKKSEPKSEPKSEKKSESPVKKAASTAKKTVKRAASK